MSALTLKADNGCRGRPIGFGPLLAVSCLRVRQVALAPVIRVPAGNIVVPQCGYTFRSHA